MAIKANQTHTVQHHNRHVNVLLYGFDLWWFVNQYLVLYFFSVNKVASYTVGYKTILSCWKKKKIYFSFFLKLVSKTESCMKFRSLWHKHQLSYALLLVNSAQKINWNDRTCVATISFMSKVIAVTNCAPEK